jgi:hypothetical protein
VEPWLRVARDVALLVLLPFGIWVVCSNARALRRLASMVRTLVHREAIEPVRGAVMRSSLVEDTTPASSRRYPPLPAAAARVLAEVEPALTLPRLRALAIAAPMAQTADDLADSLGLTVESANLIESAPWQIVGPLLLVDERHGARWWLVLGGVSARLLERHGHPPYRADVWHLARLLARRLAVEAREARVH